MPWRSDTTPLTLLAVVLALAWTAFIARLHVEGLSSPIDRFEEVCVDVRYILSPKKRPPPDVVLVAIDDETVRRGGAYPLPRPILASIIQAIARQKPRAIALDLLFLDHGTPEADAMLSQTLRSEPAAIAAAGLFRDDERSDATRLGSGLASLPQPTRILWPVEPMAGAAEIGLVNLSTGFGGIPRHVPLLFQGDKGVVPSFVLLAVALASGQSAKFAEDSVSFGERRMALDLGRHLALRYYGPRGTIPSVSGEAFLGPDAPDLSDRVVVIGATAVGSGDTFPTPFSAVVPGAEILATAISNLLAGDELVRTRWTRWLDAAAAAALAVVAVGLIAMRRSVVGLGLVLLLAVAWALVTLLAFSNGYWLSTALPIAAMTPGAALYGSARLWHERRHASRLADVERGLRPFQPRPVSDLLSKDPSFLAEPLIQDVAVLFVDLSGYTTLSETTDPVRMRDLLKSFHALVDAVVDDHGGFVVTFMGDGAMIMFGFPEPCPDDAARALGALTELETRLPQWGSAQATGLDHQVQARLAAHHGPVVISRLGGKSHEQITATGDTVNIASRLLEAAKINHVSTIISDCIFQAAGPDAPIDRFPEIIEVAIRGRSHSVLVRLSNFPQSSTQTDS